MMNPNMPVTIYDNANNAFNFLEILKREKEAELAKKLSNVDN